MLVVIVHYLCLLLFFRLSVMKTGIEVREISFQ